MEFDNKVLEDIKVIISSSQQRAIQAIDQQRVIMYWNLGQRIFEEEQQGKGRAGYGEQLIKFLSSVLQPEFGSGFSSRNLNLFRQFYRTFPIVHALRAQLSWTHYRKLISLQSEDQRSFYIAETEKNSWSARQLERQVDSNLYERLLLSNDKESVLAVARKEKYPTDAKEIIKDPMILEFLGLKRESSYYGVQQHVKRCFK